MVKNTAPLQPAWTWTEDDFSSIYPAAFDQQVVFSRILNDNESELLGFDGASGQLLWQSTVPTYLYDRHYRQVGSKLYFANKPRTALLCFDLVTKQLETVWTIPIDGRLSFQFFVQNGFAVCPVGTYIPDIDSTDISVHLINLQNSYSRPVMSLRTTSSSLLYNAILDPQVVLSPSGDTIFCFATQEYDSTFSLSSRFISLNISTGVRVESSALRGYYISGLGNLVVEGRYAWFLAGRKLQSLEVQTGSVIWQSPSTYSDDARLLVRQGKAFVLENYAATEAFNANTGTPLWSEYMVGDIGDLSGSFVQEGHLFLNQNGHLISINVETDCIIGDHTLPVDIGEGIYQPTVAPDGQRVYSRSYGSATGTKFLAAPLPR